MSDLVFETVHGSHLYNLARPGSDHDRFRVTTSERPRSRHVKLGDDDLIEVGVTLLLQRAASGSHQAVEALFSPVKVWGDERYRPVIEGFRVTGREVFEKYERTVKKLSFGDFKRRRHAARIHLGLMQLRDSGRLNPMLTERQVLQVTELAETFEGEALVAELASLARQ